MRAQVGARGEDGTEVVPDISWDQDQDQDQDQDGDGGGDGCAPGPMGTPPEGAGDDGVGRGPEARRPGAVARSV